MFSCPARHHCCTVKALVYCHTRDVDYASRPHFMLDDMKHVMGDDFNRAYFETVDVMANDLAFPASSPTYVADGFDDTFLSRHENEYDYVFIPDCAGVWWTAQMEGSSLVVGEKLSDIVLSVSRIVKRRGTLFFSKIIGGSDAQETTEIIISRLNQHGLSARIFKLARFANSAVVATKL